MKTIEYKGYTWEMPEDHDLDRFTAEFLSTKEGKAELAALTIKWSADKDKLPKGLIAEHTFVQWVESVRAELEEKHGATIEEIYRYHVTCTGGIADVIEYVNRCNPNGANISDFRSSFRATFGFALEQYQHGLRFREEDRRLAIKHTQIKTAGNIICSRCDGSGNWARHAGRTCFKCGGSGYIIPNKK